MEYEALHEGSDAGRYSGVLCTVLMAIPVRYIKQTTTKNVPKVDWIPLFNCSMSSTNPYLEACT